MIFTINKTIEVLEQTPETIARLTNGLSSFWTTNNEGGETWSVFDVVGHLLHGDKTDWLVRAKLILSENTDKAFIPFDRFAQFETSKGKTLQQLVEEFKTAREEKHTTIKGFENYG